jgi:hypothetical protein
MTDIDPRSDIRIAYSDDDLIVVIPLAGEVTERWSRRYEALARAKGMRASAHNRDGSAQIHLAVPLRAEGEDVLRMLDAARSLMAEADAVEQTPAASNSLEAIARRWWARQQDA